MTESTQTESNDSLSRQIIASRFVGKPAFLDRSYAQTLYASLSSANTLIECDSPIQLAGNMQMVGGNHDSYKPYRIDGGVAVIPINGSLMHKWPILGRFSAGYDAILRVVSLAIEDCDVQGILLDMDSHGGEVAGCFDTAEKLRALGQIKPIGAVCNDMNLSAGMCLASAAERRYITQTGEAGSVGVVMAHFSHEGWNKEQGTEVTLIYSGDRKVDGNPYESLPDEVFTQFQNECKALRQEFATIVSEHTGMGLDDVLATEAAVYRGEAAITVGFADELVNGHDALPAFQNYLSSQGRSTTIGATMSDENTSTANAVDDDAQPAGINAEDTAVTAESEATQARADERDRVSGILGNEEAEGRKSLAEHFAFKTDMSVEDAVSAMASAPLADDAPVGSSLDDAMASTDAPNIGAAASDNQPSDADRIVGSYAVATGLKINKEG